MSQLFRSNAECSPGSLNGALWLKFRGVSSWQICPLPHCWRPFKPELFEILCISQMSSSTGLPQAKDSTCSLCSCEAVTSFEPVTKEADKNFEALKRSAQVVSSEEKVESDTSEDLAYTVHLEVLCVTGLGPFVGSVGGGWLECYGFLSRGPLRCRAEALCQEAQLNFVAIP